jgi:HEAT repeat protein
MPPSFLEDVILKMSKTRMAKSQSIAALGILNTERTRARLVEIAEQTSVGNDSTNAVIALAKTRDPSALPVLMRIGPARPYAIWNIGLFGDKAIPFLTNALKNPGLQNDAIRGLGATGSRAAVPILIELLNNPQGAQLNLVRESLAQLTHLAAGSLFLSDAATPGQDDYRRWMAWWESKGTTAEIFNTDRCSEVKALP